MSGPNTGPNVDVACTRCATLYVTRELSFNAAMCRCPICGAYEAQLVSDDDGGLGDRDAKTRGGTIEPVDPDAETRDSWPTGWWR